ncbi:MAG: 30S ribosomal protein S13 [Candidatus Pacearchaeota archaeon]
MKEEKQQFKSLVRIANTDIDANSKVYKGLVSIKGISWAVSGALCHKIGLDRNKKVKDLTEDEIKKIEEYLEKGDIPVFLKNRKKDRETGEDKHLIGTDLNLQNELDIKRMKKIKCYKGIRHSLGQPVRGQRTKSHFRKNKNKSGGGVKRKKSE